LKAGGKTAFVSIVAPRLFSAAAGLRNKHSDSIPLQGLIMKKTTTLIAASALLPLAIAFAQSPSPSSQGQGATFESLDTDGDGRISKTEASANESVSAQFSRYDVNGDGFIERAEVSQAKDGSRGETPKQ
jgi:EF hand